MIYTVSGLHQPPGKEGVVETDESYLRASRSAEQCGVIFILLKIIKAEVLVIQIRCDCCV
jgi:hypothetical protein